MSRSHGLIIMTFADIDLTVVAVEDVCMIAVLAAAAAGADAMEEHERTLDLCIDETSMLFEMLSW